MVSVTMLGSVYVFAFINLTVVCFFGILVFVKLLNTVIGTTVRVLDVKIRFVWTKISDISTKQITSPVKFGTIIAHRY